MILGYHAEYLACPCIQCLGIDSRVVGPQGLRGDIAWGWVFAIHATVNLTDGLPPCLHHPDQIGRPLGLEVQPSTPLMVLWYQSAQVPLPAPSLSGGGSTGPPEVAGFSPQLVEAGLLLWSGMKTFHLELRWMISHSGWGWKTFHLEWRWMISHSGWGWKTFHLGRRWILFCLDPGLVGLHPVTSQRLELPESRSGLTSVGEVGH